MMGLLNFLYGKHETCKKSFAPNRRHFVGQHSRLTSPCAPLVRHRNARSTVHLTRSHASLHLSVVTCPAPHPALPSCSRFQAQHRLLPASNASTVSATSTASHTTMSASSTLQLACSRRPPCFAYPIHPSLSGLILGASAAAAGLVLGQLTKPDTAPRGPPCETCNGDGYVDCLCARWTYASSDAPRPPCQNCNGSLRTRCPRCRGGGTGVPTAIRVPIPVRIRGPLEDFLNRSVSLAPVQAGSTLGLSKPSSNPHFSSSTTAQRHRTRISRTMR